MKRIFCVLCVLMMLTVMAYSEESCPGDGVFTAAKEASILIGQRKYQKAIERVNMSSYVSAETFKRNFDMRFGGIDFQSEYAVAWTENGVWKLAVPAEAPTDSYVDAVVFTLSSECVFTNAEAAKWSDVIKAYSSSSCIKWNVEYVPAYIVIPN